MSLRTEETQPEAIQPDNQPELSQSARERLELAGMSPLEAFAAAAKEWGVEGMTHEPLQGGREMITQPKGEGWQSLGADWTLFIGLTPEGESPHYNTSLKPDETYRGITAGGRGIIGKEHPVTVLVAKLREQGREIHTHLIGSHTGWEKREPGDNAVGTELVWDDEGNLIGYIPLGKEMKLMIEGARFLWFDGPEGGRQSLILEPQEE